MLKVTSIAAAYGPVKVLSDVSITVGASEIVCLAGRNGAGKTTTLKTIMGLLPVTSGTITLNDVDLTELPANSIAKVGVGYIPQGRRLFRELTVAENLEIGLMARKESAATRDWVLSLFPRLEERLTQIAGTLSGGEQQMLATARALCLRPEVMLLDEPTEGLQPSMIALIQDVVKKMKAEGIAIVLVEQHVEAILDLADRVVFIENGVSVARATPDELRADPSMITTYLGV